MRLVILAVAALTLTACAATPGLAPTAARSTVTGMDAAVSTQETAQAVSILNATYPAFTYPTRSPFHSVAIPGAGQSPYAKASAGLTDLKLSRTAAGALGFQGIARTEGVNGQPSNFLVKGSLNLQTGKVVNATLSWLP